MLKVEEPAVKNPGIIKEEHIKVTTVNKKVIYGHLNKIIFPRMIAFVISHGSM